MRACLEVRGARESAFARALDYHHAAIAESLAPDAAPLALPPPVEARAEDERAALSDQHFHRLLKVRSALPVLHTHSLCTSHHMNSRLCHGCSHLPSLTCLRLAAEHHATVPG